MPNGDEPLIADPDQAVIVMELMGGWEPPVFLMVSMQALIGQMCSTRPGSRVPWDEWGGDAAILEVPTFSRVPRVYVCGAQMVAAWERGAYSVGWSRQYSIQTFNFSWRGHGAEESALFKDEGRFIFEPGHGMNSLDELRLLSDGSLFHLVSCLSRPAGSEAIG